MRERLGRPVSSEVSCSDDGEDLFTERWGWSNQIANLSPGRAQGADIPSGSLPSTLRLYGQALTEAGRTADRWVALPIFSWMQ